MAIIPLTFTPPDEPDITTLHIFESNAVDGVFTEIDSTAAGVYPDYITRYVTTKAVSTTDWFAIQWEDSAGALSDLSEPIQGGTTTLIGEIVNRVLLRVPSLNESIVRQEAEAVVEFVYPSVDPYSIDVTTLSKLALTELSNLTLVASQYVETSIRASTSQSYSAGMVSQTSAASSGDISNILNMLDKVEKRALRRLGIGGSIIAAIQATVDAITISGQKTSFDTSRVLSTRAIITEDIITQDLDSGIIISDR